MYKQYIKWLLLGILVVVIIGCKKEPTEPEGIGIPTLIHPISGQQVSLPVTLIWSSVENADGYTVEVDTTTDFESPVASAEPTDIYYTITILDKIKYYWRVAAIDENGERGNFTAPDSFLVVGDEDFPNRVVDIIPVGNYPTFVAALPNGEYVYVTNALSDNVSVIRTSDNRVVAIISVGNGPAGVAVLPNGNYVYVANIYSEYVSIIGY